MMSEPQIAALVCADGVYLDRMIVRVIALLRERGIVIVGAIQLEPAGRA